jgi:hypothetical protein
MPGPGYINFWIIDIDGKYVANRRIQMTQPAMTPPPEQTTNASGVAQFVIPNPQVGYEYTFTVEGPHGSVQTAVFQPNQTNVFVIVQLPSS